MRHFKVGEDIISLVMHDEALTWQIGDGIYPLVATNEARYPFVVYRRVSYSPEWTKDGDGERCTMEFAVVEPRYDRCVEIATLLCRCLEHAETDNIADMRLTNSSEDFVDDANVQRLTFEILLK